MPAPLVPLSSSPSDYALTLSANRCFHQWTTFIAPDDGKQLKVSFSTTSNFDDDGAERLPTIFIHAPMVASRYFLVWYDYLARKKGVRLILMDRPYAIVELNMNLALTVGASRCDVLRLVRKVLLTPQKPIKMFNEICPEFPGFGLTPRCAHSCRATTTIVATRAVLDHLKVMSTAFLSVSAGTVHLMNSLSSLRRYFHPKHPYAAVMVPWVLPQFSKCGLLATASMLPNSWIGSLGSVQKFVVRNVAPVSVWSGGIFDQAGSLFKTGGDKERESSEDEEKFVDCYGVGEEYKDGLDKVVTKFMFTEEFGVNDEAPFILQKNIPESYWGAAASYPDVVSSLVSAERTRQSEQTDLSKPFRLRAFFAESDMLIGDGGKVYFDSVLSDALGGGSAIDYRSETVPKTNHDTIINAIKGPFATIFEEVKDGWDDGLDN